MRPEQVSEAKTYTEHQVSEAANAALQLIIDDIECDDEWEDLLSLLVNATMTVLTSDMEATFEDVITENYGESVDEFKSERGF
jgi:outer membrane protein assembly factor BamD (BamD/ComL family)